VRQPLSHRRKTPSAARAGLHPHLLRQLVRRQRDRDRAIVMAGRVVVDPKHPGSRLGVATNGIELHLVLSAKRIVCRPGTPPQPPTTTVAPPTTTAPPPPTATAQTTTAAGNCAPSYQDVCITPPPPDLNCADIPYRNFRVIYTVPDRDPYRFDADHDGIGCES
jgi:hypothetical protein